MENEKLIRAKELKEKLQSMRKWFDGPPQTDQDKLARSVVKLCIEEVDKLKPVDAVEVADMREFAEDVAYQFGYYCQHEGRLHIIHGGLSTLESAFYILGWENPHPAPECECEIDGCHEHATGGAPTADGYKRMCGRHYRERKDNE